jgi:hypothetical protein
MKCGWGCGEQLTGRNMHALHSMREAAGGLCHVDREGGNSKVKRGLPLGTPQTAAHAKSPAPIPLGAPRRLILGHASAMKMQALAPNQPQNGIVEEIDGTDGCWTSRLRTLRAPGPKLDEEDYEDRPEFFYRTPGSTPAR